MENLTNEQATENQEQTQTQTENKEQTFTFTQQELDDLIQRKCDQRVTQALKTAEKKQKEAEKLSKMSDTEKYQYQLEEREKQIAEKERALTLAENKNAVSKILAEKGISLALVDFCVDEDADEMDKKIKLLDAEFKKSVKAEVEKRLSSNTPKVGLPRDDSLTKEKFRKLSVIEQQELYRNNKELYEQLTN